MHSKKLKTKNQNNLSFLLLELILIILKNSLIIFFLFTFGKQTIYYVRSNKLLLSTAVSSKNRKFVLWWLINLCQDF